ncbi:hypothetical protein BMS3Bbin10_01540 [bacterium BMS3Bbin10]|nr:hypothetical protein BMS3Bbin10_01540 [bacterium BMS3Bbin10]
MFRGLWKQLQHRTGNDAERALGPDKQVFQVITRIVLAERAQPVPDTPVGQYHLKSQNHVPRIAIGQHGRSAGIGGEIAADLAAPFRSKRERKQPAHLLRRRLRPFQYDAGIERHGVAFGVDCADCVHS